MAKIFDMKPAGPGGGVSNVVALPDHSAGKVRRRRSWSLEEKLRIVEEAETSGDPVAVVARRHDMNANHLFSWIDRARAGSLGRDGRRARPTEEPPPEFIDLGVYTRDAGGEAGRDCVLEIDLPGGLRLRVPASIEAEALTRAVRALRAA